jgi:hypothetical protein
MKAQHTPGPWHVTGDYVRNENDGLVGEALNLWANVKTPIDERKANARLIAAAPDLLAALKMAVDSMTCAFPGGLSIQQGTLCEEQDWDTSLREARAAIAKAAGQCEACSTGTMAGPIPGTLSNGERCDACERYENDEAARAEAGGDK